MALGHTQDDAIVAGFLEYLEHEAVNGWWRRRQQADRVCLEPGEGEVVDTMLYFHRQHGRSLFALRLPSPLPGVQVVIAVSSLDEFGFPLLGMGAAFSLTAAVAKAFRELGQGLAFAQAEKRKWASMPPAAVRWLAGQSEASFSKTDDGYSAADPGPRTLAHAAELSRAVGRTPLVLDYERPEVPFSCVRVLVPRAAGTESGGKTATAGWSEFPW